MLTLLDILPNLNNPLTNDPLPHNSATTFFNQFTNFLENNKNSLLHVFAQQYSVLTCLTEISISLASDLPHKAPFPAILHSIIHESPKTITSPYESDPIPFHPNDLDLSPQFFDTLTTTSNVLALIHGPFVLHYYDSHIIITWHSPTTPKVHQSNLNIASLTTVLYTVLHHLHKIPYYKGTTPLTKDSLFDISLDIMQSLNFDTSVTQLLPHLYAPSGPITSNIYRHIQSFISSSNIIACSYKKIITSCFPEWFTPLIPLNATRNLSLTHHNEFPLCKQDNPPSTWVNYYTLTMDITPYHAALQRITSHIHLPNITGSRKLSLIQNFLVTCPPHIYLAILQYTLVGSSIPCSPASLLDPHLKANQPLIFYHPRFGLFNDPDTASAVQISIMTIHTDHNDVPSILTRNQTIHCSHYNVHLTHAFHLYDDFEKYDQSQPIPYISHLGSSYNSLYHYKFIPRHAYPTRHLTFWPLAKIIPSVHPSSTPHFN